MNKLRITIPLMLLVILAFFTIQASPHKYDGSSANITQTAGTINSADHNPVAEIEHCNIFAPHLLNNYPSSQKTTGYPVGDIKNQPAFSVIQVDPDFPVIELFDNHYLSYNYPSHHFW